MKMRLFYLIRMCEMSFRDAIQKQKKGLNVTQTKITQADGSVIIETRDSDDFARISYPNASYGFIVDTKPDLQVALVFPWLLFGSQDVACDENLLRELCITNILSLGISVPHFNDIEYNYMDVLDVPEFNLLNLFTSCYNIIDSVREMNGKLFVHCNAGISRSSSIVIAYKMRHSRCSLDEALEVVKNARPCARPNAGFMEQLRIYETRLSVK